MPAFSVLFACLLACLVDLYNLGGGETAPSRYSFLPPVGIMICIWARYTGHTKPKASKATDGFVQFLKPRTVIYSNTLMQIVQTLPLAPSPKDVPVKSLHFNKTDINHIIEVTGDECSLRYFKKQLQKQISS